MSAGQDDRIDPNTRMESGLSIDLATGHPIQRTACGDSDSIVVRSTLEGTIANAETVSSKELGTGKISQNGLIYVRSAKSIGLRISSIIGSLTSMDIIPEFSDDLISLGFSKLAVVSNASGVMTVNPFIIRLTTTVNFFIMIPNPGGLFMRIKTASVGVITSSSVNIFLTRGWGHGLPVGL